MAEDKTSLTIGQNLLSFQASLRQAGMSLEEYLKQSYFNKWLSDEILAALRIRTTLVVKAHEFLAQEGLVNIDRISFSLITDPLAHDVEHVPTINYKGQTYVTTHSMIYHKFMACHNKGLKGIFVDSPNIRLEIEAPFGGQRGKYLADFSQIDIEIKRNRGIGLDEYLNKPEYVKEVLATDMDKALNFFERLLIYVLKAIALQNKAELDLLGVEIDVPSSPFPRFYLDYGKKKYQCKNVEANLGEETKSQVFWIIGLLRENYDLIYPYLKKDGKVPLSSVTSEMIYNYDLCVKSLPSTEKGKMTTALEVLSGAIREWLFEPIVERLIDNKILSTRPIFKDGNIENIDELGSYGPFLTVVASKDENGQPLFPDTLGGGLGIERMLYAMLRGNKIKKIDDITLFGKNPDSAPLFLF